MSRALKRSFLLDQVQQDRLHIKSICHNSRSCGRAWLAVSYGKVLRISSW